MSEGSGGIFGKTPFQTMLLVGAGFALTAFQAWQMRSLQKKLDDQDRVLTEMSEERKLDELEEMMNE